jgi:hypothetical protein
MIWKTFFGDNFEVEEELFSARVQGMGARSAEEGEAEGGKGEAWGYERI